MKVLLSCPIGIGNYLLAYPACAAIKKHRPELSLHLLGLRENLREWAAVDPLWDGVHVFDPTKRGALRNAIGVISRLKRLRFDACLNFFPQNKWQYNLVPVLAGIGRRYAFRYPLKRFSSLTILANRLLDVDPRLHDWQQNMALAAFFLDCKLSDDPPVFPCLFEREHEQWARSFVRQHCSRLMLIGMHPGSSVDHGMEAKRWPPDRFGRLADLAAAYFNADVVVVGGPEESHLKKAVASAACKATVVAADTPSLQHTAALVRQCGLMICNDSGIMHIAACLGVPTVGIFGPTDERRNGPIGPNTLVVRHEMPGFPLWTARNVGVRRVKPSVDPMAPLKALSAEEAWEKIHRWWEEKSHG